MKGYVEFIVRHRIAVVVATLLLTLFFGFQARHLELEVRRRANLPEQHPYVEIQNRISDLFGGESIVIVGLVSKRGTIFTPDFLGKVARFTEGLLRIPGVVDTALFGIAGPQVKTIGVDQDGAMVVRPLMEAVPTDHERIRALREEILEDDLLRRNLISDDETATLIVADFGEDLSDVELVSRIQDLVESEEDESVSIALAGAPVLRAELTRYTSMIAVLFPLAVVVIGLVHYEAFRTFQAMILPLATALISVVWSLGIMGLLGAPLDTWSAMTPVLILAVAAGHAVQMLKRYYEDFSRLGDSKQAVVTSVSAIGPVMLTAGFVASAGFASLATFGILSVKVFGLLLALGILSALLVEMTFTPACRSLLPPPKTLEAHREREPHIFARSIDRLGDYLVSQPRKVLGLVLSVCLFLGIGALFLQTDNSFRLWFAPGTRIREDDALLNSKLPGTATLRILIEGHEDRAVFDPNVLMAMSDLQGFLEQYREIGGTSSIADHVKRINGAMNTGDPSFDGIPRDANLIAQYLFLYSMSAGPDGLSAFVDSEGRNAVIRALSKTDSAVFSRDLLQSLSLFATQRFRGLPATARIAGGTLGVQTAMNDVVVEEKLKNMLQVALIICLLCGVVFGSIVAVGLVLFPLALATLATLGIMGWTGTWLDMSTAGITAMGVSLGADFSIYLLFRIREERMRGRSIEDSIYCGMTTSGRAIFSVASAVVAGYMMLPLSGFSIWMRLGLLTASLVTMSALAALTVVPAIVVLLRPAFILRVSDR